MSTIEFENGIVVEFDGTPTQKDVDEIASQLKIGGSTPSRPKKSLLNKVTNITTSIFPGGKVGESIGTLAGYGVTAAREKLGQVPKGTTEQFDLSSPSPLQTTGDVALGALSLGGLKGVSGSFLQRVAKLAGLGAGISGSEAISEGESFDEVTKQAAIGAGIGASFPIAGGALGLAGQQINQLPARFVNSALGRSKAQVLQDISKNNVDDFSKYVLNNKRIGTAQSLIKESRKQMNNLDSKIATALGDAKRKTGGNVTVGVNNLLDDIAKTPEAEGALLKRADIKSIIERLAPQSKKLLQKGSLNLTETNKLRQLLDTTLGDRAFLGGQLSSDKQILKSFANNLRETVKTKSPAPVRELFKEYSNEIRFSQGLQEKVAQRAGNQVLTFGDFIGGGLGGVFGGGAGGAIAGVAARRALESVPFKLGAAKVINAVSKAGPVLDELTPPQQTAILVLISELISGENDQTDSSTPAELQILQK